MPAEAILIIVAAAAVAVAVIYLLATRTKRAFAGIESDDEQRRVRAALVLGRSGSSAARDALMKIVKEARMSRKLTDRPAMAAIVGLGLAGEERAFDMLKSLITDDDWRVLESGDPILRTLASWGSPLEEHPSPKSLKDGAMDASVGLVVASTLGRIDPDRTGQLLVKAMRADGVQNLDRLVRLVQSLGGDEEACQVLCKRLRNKAPHCDREVSALGVLGDPGAIEPLLEVAKNEDAYEDTRRSAIAILEDLGADKARTRSISREIDLASARDRVRVLDESIKRREKAYSEARAELSEVMKRFGGIDEDRLWDGDPRWEWYKEEALPIRERVESISKGLHQTESELEEAKKELELIEAKGSDQQ